jgi:Holliday junction resolvase RusA-like endonuclease
MNGELITRVFVPGKSRTKGSWTAKAGHFEAPEGMYEWARQVAQAVSAERHARLGSVAARPYDGPVSVSLTVSIRPAGPVETRPAYPTRLRDGDIDKHSRLVLDALKTGGAYRDDSLVVALSVVQIWAGDDIPPGVNIEVYTAVPPFVLAPFRAIVAEQIARQGMNEETGL